MIMTRRCRGHRAKCDVGCVQCVVEKDVDVVKQETLVGVAATRPASA